MQSLFITATDTGVGKTTFAAALLAQARARGVDAVPMKPVQTGCEHHGSVLVAPDLEFCLTAAGLKASDEERDWMCPYRFEPACSPHLAARMAGVNISMESILAAWRKLAARHDTVLVEGAGGLLVPLNEKDFMLDLMKAMKIPAVLIARAGLGTLNHTLLSLREIERAGLPVKGIVLISTHRDEPGDIREDNLQTIRRLADVPAVIHMPFNPSLDTEGKPAASHDSNHWNIPEIFFQSITSSAAHS